MASVDATASAKTTAEVTSLTFALTVGTGSNRALLVDTSNEDSAWDITAVTYAGTTMTQQAQTNAGSFSRAEMWGLVAPASGSANVVVTINNIDWIMAGAISATAVDQTTPFRTAVTLSSASTTAVTVTVASVGANDLVVDAISLDSNVTITAGANQTEWWEVSETGKVTGGGSFQAGSDGGVMSYSGWTARPVSYCATAFIDDGAGTTAAGQPTMRRWGGVPYMGMTRQMPARSW